MKILQKYIQEIVLSCLVRNKKSGSQNLSLCFFSYSQHLKVTIFTQGFLRAQAEKHRFQQQTTSEGSKKAATVHDEICILLDNKDNSLKDKSEACKTEGRKRPAEKIPQ